MSRQRTVSVTMTEGSWQVLYSVALQQAMQMEAEDRREMARKLMNRIVPSIGHAAQQPHLEPVERDIRERLGLPSTLGSRRTGRLLVEEVKPDPRFQTGRQRTRHRRRGA